MKIYLLPVVALATVCINLNTVYSQGSRACPNYTVIQNFSLDSYLGTWYEIENTIPLIIIDASCVETNFSYFGNGSLRMDHTETNELGSPEYFVGNVTPENANSTEAKFMLTFPSIGPIEAPYWVLDTDYSNFSIIWSCRYDFNSSSNIEGLWFYSRDRTPTQSVRDHVHDFLTGINFNLARLKETPQANCTL